MTTAWPRASIRAVLAAGLLLVAGCSGDDTGDGAGAATGTSSAEAEASSTTTTGADSDTAAAATTTLPDTPVGHYAEAVVGATTSDAAIGGSPAAVYLAYLAKMTELTGQPVGRVGGIDDDGFVLVQAAGADIVYDRFERSDLGVADLDMDGRPLSDIVAVLSRPVRDPSGVEAVGGYAFTSYGANRVVVVTVHNGTDQPLTVDPLAASWIEISGYRHPAEAIGLGGPVELAPGATADVINTFPRGDAEPDGVLDQVIGPAADGSAAGLTLAIPFGRGRATFFTAGPGGTLEGELDADIAFATGSAEPSLEAIEILFKAAQEILVHDPTSALCVAGHADSVGGEADNLELSQARADAVAAVLRDDGVTNPIVAVGYGEAFAPGEELDDPGSRRVAVSFADCPEAPPSG